MSSPPAVPGPAIVIEHVTKTFRRAAEVVVAVDDASLTLRGGELVALLGPSGAGKSTLLDLLLGWQHADSGTIGGIPQPTNWRQLAVVPQQLGLLPHLTLFENVELASRILGERNGTRDADIDSLLDQLGIADLSDRFPSETSLGEQQRCAVARCLVGKPDIVIADEPTSHQDDRSATRVIDALDAAAIRNAVVLVATHDPRICTRATRVLTMLDGRIARPT